MEPTRTPIIVGPFAPVLRQGILVSLACVDFSLRASSTVSRLAARAIRSDSYRLVFHFRVPSALIRFVYPQDHPSMAKLHFFMNHGLASQLLESQG
jgi:hypothetical protein